MSIKRLFWLILVTTSIIGLVSAQNDTCPAVINTILETVGNACDDMGRNQICYGNDSVTALDFESSAVDDFSVSGDITDITDIATLETAPFNLSNSTWGIALLVLQLICRIYCPDKM